MPALSLISPSSPKQLGMASQELRKQLGMVSQELRPIGVALAFGWIAQAQQPDKLN